MYYLLFGYDAWCDGTTYSMPAWTLLALCLSAVASPPPGAFATGILRVSGALVLTTPVLLRVRRREMGDGDGATVLAVGLRHGVTGGASVVVIATLALAFFAEYQRRGRPELSPLSVRSPGTALPLVPSLLAADVLWQVLAGGIR